MERLITATEANQRFSELLRDVQSGETFVVTSRGRAVARMIPIDDDAKQERDRKFAALMERLDALPFQVIGPWTREDLYD